MTKQTIAIDIDDVLADTTDALRLFVNQKFGLELKEHHYRIKSEYWGYYETVWAHNGLETEGILDEFHAKYTLSQADTKPVQGSKDGVANLAAKYRLIAVSSRGIAQQAETERWMHDIFGDVFDVIRCIDTRKTGMEKGEVCHELGASYLIDDNVDHCSSAIKSGLTAILFGMYGWQHEDRVSEKAVRCINWDEVTEYFDAQ